MSQDTEDLAARLAALEGTTGKKAGRPSPSPMTALLGIGGIAVAGLLAWVALQPAAPDPKPTAAPEEFQTTGSGFGTSTTAALAAGATGLGAATD